MNTAILSFLQIVYFLGLLAALPSYGQGTIGFSSQTQPAELRSAQTISKATLKGLSALPPADQYKAIQAELSDTNKKTKPIPSASLSLVPDTSLSIAESSKLLDVFDDLSSKSSARKGLGNWRLGIVSDGDFNKPITGAVTTGKAGSLGIDAVFLKDVYTEYTYYLFEPGKEIPKGLSTEAQLEWKQKYSAILKAWQHVARPRVALSTLVVLFAGTTALGTGVPAGGSKSAVPTNLELQRMFGQALLIPNGYIAGNGLSFSSNLTYYLGTFRSLAAQDGLSEVGRLGVSATLVAVQSNWRTRDTTTIVNILAPSLGLVYRAAEGRFKIGNQETYAQIQPFVRYTMRHLFGDVATNWGGRLLTDALGTDERSYHAIDFGITLSINTIRLTTNLPIFFGKKIEGFSRGQLVAGFGLAATIPVN